MYKKNSSFKIGMNGKGHIMNVIKIGWLVLFMILICLMDLHAQEFGKIRALDHRAVYIIQQRNDFITRVLSSYAIPHECNQKGAVVRIMMDGQWQNVTAIEIVPVLKEAAEKQQQVTAHELLFYTANGILDLLSELTIR
jgi:hypothetical protein